jgi:ABC-type antimicrobial peptide transport system permease subunit
MAPWRFSVWIFVMFALLAVLLTAVGLFGAVSLDGASRRRELAIRLAVGAAPASLVLGIIRRTVVQLLPGVAIGFAVSLLALRALRGFLFEVTSIGAPTLAAVAVLVATAILVASLVPAFAATRVQPSATLNLD